MSTRWLVLAIGWLLLACATTSARETVIRNTGEPCPNPRYIEFQDGSRFFQLSGRLVSRERSDVVRPIKSARIFYWVARDNPKAKPLELAFDAQSNFTVEVGLPWSAELVCREGRIVETEYVGEEYFLVRADGCSDLKLTVNPKWVPHDVVLQCRKSGRTG